MSNYIDDLAADIYAAVPTVCPQPLLRLYAVLALVKGPSVSLQDVHDAWSAWAAATHPAHPSLIPFDELDHEVQELDRPYRDAIRRVSIAWSHRT